MNITPSYLQKGFRYLKRYGIKGFCAKVYQRLQPETISYEAWRKRNKLSKRTLKKQRQEQETWESRPLISLIVLTGSDTKAGQQEKAQAVQQETTQVVQQGETEAVRQETAQIAQQGALQEKSGNFLQLTLDSIQAQTYTNWEICIAEGTDCQKLNKEPSGAWIGFLQAGDLLEAHALYEVVKAIQARHIDVVYTDEDEINERLEYVNPNFKPDFSMDLLRSTNYMEHFLLVKRGLYVDENKCTNKSTYAEANESTYAEVNESTYAGANENVHTEANGCAHQKKQEKELWRSYVKEQSYDFVFRCVEQAGKIYHVPEMLYHTRVQGNFTDLEKDSISIYSAENTSLKYTTDNNSVQKLAGTQEIQQALERLEGAEAGKHAIQAHLKRQNIPATVTTTKLPGCYAVTYPVQGNPKVSILIPNKDEIQSLEKCIASIERSTYDNVEIIIVENNSQKAETFDYYKTLHHRKYEIQVVQWESGFNYSAINNFGFTYTTGEYIILLNNDIEILNPHWIEEMLGNCQRPEVGIVGAKLYYPDDTIQHAGVVLGMGAGLVDGGVASAVFVGLPRKDTGYQNKASVQLNYSAVTAACLMVKRSIYEEVGGLEEELAVAFNDIDFCLKVVEKGYLVVYLPKVEAYHYESKSRGKEDTPEKIARFQREIAYMQKKWGDWLRQDPYYNRNLSLSNTHYGLRVR